MNIQDTLETLQAIKRQCDHDSIRAAMDKKTTGFKSVAHYDAIYWGVSAVIDALMLSDSKANTTRARKYLKKAIVA